MARKGSGSDGDKPKYRDRKRVMSDEDAMAKLITGRRTKFPTWSGRAKDLAKAHGDDGAKDRVGVSKSTWRAWLKGKRSPNKANMDKLRSELNSADVRRAGISKFRRRKLDKMAESGAVLKFTAFTGPRDARYARMRKIRRDLPPEVAAEMQEAWINGGPDAARAVIVESLREYYQENTESGSDMNVIFEDIHDIKFE
jgi:hypothetical protein